MENEGTVKNLTQGTIENSQNTGILRANLK